MGMGEIMKQVDIRKLTGGPPQAPRELIENMRLTLDAFEHAKAAYAQGLQGAPGQLNTTVEVILFQVPSLLKAMEETLDERDKLTEAFGRQFPGIGYADQRIAHVRRLAGLEPSP